MPALVSADMDPDVFSPPPLYSIEIPPEVTDASVVPPLELHPSDLRTEPRVFLTPPYDAYAETAEPANTNTYTVTAAHDDESTQSVFLEHDYGSNSPRHVLLSAMLLNDLWRSVFTAVRNELVHSHRLFPSLNVWVAFSETSDVAQLYQNIDRISFNDTAHEYFTILADCLKPKSFSRSEEYEDPLGGKVTDYFRDEERITCIVSLPHVQVLSFLQGTFHDQVFDRKAATKPSLVEYLEGLVGDKKEQDLEAARDV